MSDEEQSVQSSPYSSDADEDDLGLNEYAEEDVEAEVEAEVEEVEAEGEGEGEGEAEQGEDSDDDDEADSDDDSDEEEEEEDQEDAEGDEDDDEAGDLEAALENMEVLDDEAPEYEETSKDSEELVVVPDIKPETPAQRRRGLFVTNPPYPKSYTIDPICALPHPVATHSLAASQCMTYLLTGSEDGFVRCYDFFASVNGKTYLTAPQRHHCGIGEGTMKAGVLKMWWENYAPTTTAATDGSADKGEGDDSKALSSVHSMVMQADALWGLSGTATGNINLTTVRHDPGRTHHTIAAHGKSPVSCLTLQPDEQGALSAGWDGDTKQWDLNTGQMVRMFGTQRHSGGVQVVSLGLRPSTPLTTNGVPHSDLFSSGDATGGVLAPNHRNDDDGSGDSTDNSLFGDDSADEDERPKASKANGFQALQQGTGPNATRNSSSHSPDILMTAYIDGQVLLWDRRAPVQSKPLRLEMGEKSPPWCVSACWSANGHEIYAGRRIGTIDVWDIRQVGNSSASGPRLLKSLRNPASSGPVTCVAGFPDGQHLVCASQDNIRLWKVSDETLPEHKRTAPFKIIAGHHGGVISQILVDSSSRFLITASGNRGWFWLGESTRTVLVHDITPVLR